MMLSYLSLSLLDYKTSLLKRNVLVNWGEGRLFKEEPGPAIVNPFWCGGSSGYKVKTVTVSLFEALYWIVSFPC